MVLVSKFAAQKVVVLLIVGTSASVDATLADYELQGSCVFTTPWNSDSSCMEFRGDIWTADSMAERCDIESDSTLSQDVGCATSDTFAGWCVKDAMDSGYIEGTSMTNSDYADCAANMIACETYVGGAFEPAAGCDTTTESIEDSSSNIDILIESFENPNYLWESFADSDRMDGESTGSMEIVDGIGVLTASVSDVSNRNVPAMVQTSARGLFPDLSSCDGLKMMLMTTEDEEYTGYKVDFGFKKLPDSVYAWGYRSSLTVPSGSSFSEVTLPFDDFTLSWDHKTGNQIFSCQDDASFCPDDVTLQNLETLTISASGVEGDVQLHVESISGTGCDVDDSVATSREGTDSEKEDQWTCSSSANPSSDEITIESFSNPSLSWMTLNDPVMGGKSSSTMLIEEETAIFTGEVRDIPFLGVPGFIQMEARGGTYPDVSCCDSLKLTLMGMEEYAGYRVSFGTKRREGGGFASGFKADFDAPINTYDSVIIPFNMFSVNWDEATGDQITTCAQDPEVCPDVDTLRNMQTIALWAEGVNGEINLHVRSISAVGCSSSVDDATLSVNDTVPSMDAAVEIKGQPSVDSAVTSSDDALPNAVVVVKGLTNMVSNAIDNYYGTPPPTAAPTAKEENAIDDMVNTVNDAIDRIGDALNP